MPTKNANYLYLSNQFCMFAKQLFDKFFLQYSYEKKIIH